MISFYKSIIDQDRASIVICNLKHEIIYMNPAAVNSYAKRGGDKLIGRSLLDCHNQESRDKIQKVVDWFRAMRAITLSILSIIRSRIKMFIWLHSEKRED
jgi:PAS domain-containing protein